MNRKMMWIAAALVGIWGAIWLGWYFYTDGERYFMESKADCMRRMYLQANQPKGNCGMHYHPLLELWHDPDLDVLLTDTAVLKAMLTDVAIADDDVFWEPERAMMSANHSLRVYAAFRQSQYDETRLWKLPYGSDLRLHLLLNELHPEDDNWPSGLERAAAQLPKHPTDSVFKAGYLTRQHAAQGLQDFLDTLRANAAAPAEIQAWAYLAEQVPELADAETRVLIQERLALTADSVHRFQPSSFFAETLQPRYKTIFKEVTGLERADSIGVYCVSESVSPPLSGRLSDESMRLYQTDAAHTKAPSEAPLTAPHDWKSYGELAKYLQYLDYTPRKGQQLELYVRRYTYEYTTQEAVYKYETRTRRVSSGTKTSRTEIYQEKVYSHSVPMQRYDYQLQVFVRMPQKSKSWRLLSANFGSE